MRRFSRQVYSFVRDVIREFNRDRSPLFAAAISFYGLISLIPLLLLAIGIFGYIIGSEVAFQRVVYFVRDLIPVSTMDLETNLRALSRQSGLLSGLGLIGLIWTGSQVFVILQQVMNIALGAKKPVGFIRSRLVAIGMLVVSGVLFTLSILITSLIAALSHNNGGFWGIDMDGLSFIWNFLSILGTVIISVLAFTFIYRFLPTKNIGLKAPLVGGITAGVLFEIAKHAFRWYVSNVANYSRIYGSLGSVVVLIVWIYFVSMITVIGAEVASVYAKRQQAKGGK